ncbi:hypothetical protein LINPERPRIM_LOCUS16809 [Linum perenne]
MEATIPPGGRVGRCFLQTKSVSIKPLQEPLRLLKDLAVPNSRLCSSRQLHIGVARCHRRDPSADKGNEGGKSAKARRTWWSDEPPEMDSEEEVELGLLEELIESLWILKGCLGVGIRPVQILEPYGWGVPVIMVSWLAASGPKAFLMALAIPLGQSVVTFAIGRLLGTNKKKKKKKRPKEKRRVVNRKRPSSSPWKRRPRNINEIIEEVEEEERRRKEEEGASGKVRYESWVDSNGAFGDKGPGKQPSSPSNKAAFGGWEELDGLRFTEQKPKPAAAGKKRRQPRGNRVTTVNGKPSNMRMRETSETPLVLRLLIAVFPFLASWTKMF